MLVKPSLDTVAKIKVIGVGGGGCNAVNTMINDFAIEGVEFIAINTDEQVLKKSLASIKLQIGSNLTKGLGAGGNPDIGAKAAQESAEDIVKLVEGADMVFITGGMGGGTGTGAIPVVAEIAKNAGALTVAVVTKPFNFEGPRRAELAEEGISKLKSAADTMIVIPNSKLLKLSTERLTFKDALRKADEVLARAIESISGLITKTGLMNVDFADVKTILKDAGTAMLGIGTASGEGRAIEAAKLATTSPLLDLSISGAKGILINITAHPEGLTTQDVEDAAKVIGQMASNDAFIKFGTVFEEDKMTPEDIQISIIAAGFTEPPQIDEQEISIPSVEVADTDTSITPQISTSTSSATNTIEPDGSNNTEKKKSSDFTSMPDLEKPAFLRKNNIPDIFKD